MEGNHGDGVEWNGNAAQWSISISTTYVCTDPTRPSGHAGPPGSVLVLGCRLVCSVHDGLPPIVSSIMESTLSFALPNDRTAAHLRVHMYTTSSNRVAPLFTFQ